MKNIILFITIISSVYLISCVSKEPVAEVSNPVIKTPVEVATVQNDSKDKIPQTPPATLNENEIKKAETDIATLIDKLNKIIASKDYENWKIYLSDNYINYYSDPEVLKEKTQSPLLIKYKIVLRSLEDYFNYVVVGSRQNVKLDEIKVLDRNRIKAYMIIKDTPVIIYELVRIDNEWKIGKF